MFLPSRETYSGFSMDYYRGPAQETFYSRNPGYRPSYEDVRHMVEAGKLIEIFYDFEASDKLAGSAVPKEYAALAFDLQGALAGASADTDFYPQASGLCDWRGDCWTH